MIYEIESYKGTFRNEPSFKRDYIKRMIGQKDRKSLVTDVISIENILEEGQPDLLMIDDTMKATFIELKHTTDNYITLERSQPIWFKRHSKLVIFVISFRQSDNTLHIMDAEYVLANIKNFRVRLEK